MRGSSEADASLNESLFPDSFGFFTDEKRDNIFNEARPASCEKSLIVREISSQFSQSP
jgi:hypothetical protein